MSSEIRSRKKKETTDPRPTSTTSAEPNSQTKKRVARGHQFGLIIKLTILLFIVVLILVNTFLPIVLTWYPSIVSAMIFQAFIQNPFNNLSDPVSLGMNDTYSFKLAHKDEDVVLGAWHILPEKSKMVASSDQDNHFKLNLVQDPEKETIITLYLHGNTKDRASTHRLSLYKRIRSLGSHIIALDYRGYGDSSGKPSERGLVKDALLAYDFIRTVAPWAKVYIWGHSLGTGVTSHASGVLATRDEYPTGIILEAPFYNMIEEVQLHPISYAYFYNKWAVNAIKDALEQVNLQFRSDIHLLKVKSKIMILHSEDDLPIPVKQGVKLYEEIKKNGVSENVVFHRLPGTLGCGHNKIYRAPDFQTYIRDFIN